MVVGPGRDETALPVRGARKVRSDAQRNLEALLAAAGAAFAERGVGVPMREIAERAGVGVGTLYRHFPRRSDLITAVFQREVDRCAEAGPLLADEHEPVEALTRWLLRFTGFVATKQGLAAALHSGDPAYQDLPAYFVEHLRPTLQALLDTAAATGTISPEIGAEELLIAVSRLCTPGPAGSRADHTDRMITLLISGMRYDARPTP
jgi:AcrR family transcriptional regulator